MGKVTGIGDVFFKTKHDNKALADWYHKHLGMRLEDFGGALLKWSEDKAEDNGVTVWHIAEKIANGSVRATLIRMTWDAKNKRP